MSDRIAGKSKGSKVCGGVDGGRARLDLRRFGTDPSCPPARTPYRLPLIPAIFLLGRSGSPFKQSKDKQAGTGRKVRPRALRPPSQIHPISRILQRLKFRFTKLNRSAGASAAWPEHVAIYLHNFHRRFRICFAVTRYNHPLHLV